MAVRENGLKAALARGELQRGLWLNAGAQSVTEIAGRAGFDWCLVDGEHGPYDPTTIEMQLSVLEATGTEAVVRVPQNESWILKQVLDLGAQSVLVPMVNTPEEAAAAVAACRYPPAGIRGMGAMVARAGHYGAIGDYAATADAQICVMVQAESRAALDHLDAICATEGLAGVFIGPADLSADMGHGGDTAHPEVVAACEDAIARIARAGLAPGIITGDPALQARYIAAGVTFLGVGGDVQALADALAALARG